MLDVTKEAKEVFGNIVVSAFSKNGIFFKHHERYHFDYTDYDQSDFDADTIKITFINGVTVEIGNSEWGWIRRVLPDPPEVK